MRTPLIRLALAPIAGALLLAPALDAQQPTASATAPDSARIEPAAWKGAGPNGATLRCRDRSYPAPRSPDSACDAKGGVLVRYPLVPVPGPARRSAPATAGAPVPAAAPTPAPAPTAVGAPSGTTPTISRPPLPPADATLLCHDGTFIQADTASSRCGTHGGVRGRFPLRPRASVRRP